MRSSFPACDIPIRSALLENGAQVLTQISERRAAEKPIAIVDLVHDEARFQNDYGRNHRIVFCIGVFCDVEILLHDSPGIREKRPVRADA